MSVTRRRVAVALVALLGLPVVAAAIAIAAVALLDASIDVSRWRTALAERAGAALGRPVRVDGPLELRLGREAELGIGALGIGHAPGHAASDLATLDGVRVRIDLPAALRGRLRLRALDIAAVRVRLERTDDGGARLPGARPPAEETQTTAPAAPHLEHLTIRRLVVERADARGDARPLIELEQLVASEERGGALKAAARARARGSPTCSIAVEGAASHVLRAADRPWPFTLELGCPRTRLHASGRLERGRRAVRASFGAGVESLEDIESALGRALPKLAAAALAGELVATADVIELAELRGRVGDAVVTGALALHLGGARARLTGELTADALDLQHLLAGATPRDGTLLDDEALARQALPLRDAPAVDAELVLRARHLVGLGVQDARLDLEADARGVRAPIAATVGGVPLAGRIELAVAAAAPEVSLEVEANDVPLATLARSFDGAAGVEGRLGRLALRLVSRGDTLGALARDLDLRLEVASARLRARPRAGGRPFEMRLDALELAAPRGQPLRGTARGALLGEPVRLKLRGGTVAQILREQATPVALELAAREATARVSGTLARPDAARDLDLAFRLAAPRAGDLARRAGADPEAGPPVPLALHGRLRIGRERWQLAEAIVRIGRSEFSVDARSATADGQSVVVASVRSPLIDATELAALFKRPAGGSATSGDAPILPQRLRLPDADVRFDLARVVLGRNEFVAVGADARIRDGRIASSPWAARFAGVAFEGRAALDMRGDAPELALSMSARDVDVGALLRTLRIAEVVDERAATLEAELASRGRGLRELLDGATLKARLTGGDLTVRGPADKTLASIQLDEVAIGASPGAPLTVRLDGTLDATPATITVAAGTLADLARASAHLPFALEARAAGARLALDGEVTLPLGRGGKLVLALGGERLDSLASLVRAELPPWGPWSIGGPIAMSSTGYAVPQLTVQVGESRLYGTGRLDLAGARPSLSAHIRAPHVQLDDFPFDAPRERAPGASRTEQLRATVRDTARQTEALLSRAFLRRFDASLVVEVGQVLSGADRLGGGQLGLELVDGLLAVEPLMVNLPGGGARLYASYDTRGREVDLVAGARIERFDYGVLARRNRPDADIQGLLSLDMEIRSRAPSLDAIFARADGHIDFAVWPRDLRGGVLDRWAVNLFLALLPFLDPGSGSKVNCLVGRLDLDGGVLTHDALVIDTTRVRALGSGRADLRTEEIAFRFRPRAKGAAFFSLQTPLSVSGTMTDFRIAPTRGDFAEAFARLIASVITLPLETLIHGPLPRDGADVCIDPLRADARTAGAH